MMKKKKRGMQERVSLLLFPYLGKKHIVKQLFRDDIIVSEHELFQLLHWDLVCLHVNVSDVQLIEGKRFQNRILGTFNVQDKKVDGENP